MALLSCGGLSSEGVQAREALSAALATRDVASVSGAARAAAAWQGQDPALDRMLGDALANVLMKPEEGWPLLLANPAPEDPSWGRALRGAALRSGDSARVVEAWRRSGAGELPGNPGLVAQIGARARKDPAFDVDGAADLLRRCALLGRRPLTGRRALGMAVDGDLFAAARALGAQELVLARSLMPIDQSRGEEIWRCADMVLLETGSLPSPLPPRVTVLGASDGRTEVFLELREEEGVPVAFVASHAEHGARWMRAASLWAEAGGGEAGAARVREVLGEGLGGVAFPGEPR